MAKKKNLKENDFIDMYVEYVLEHNENPDSVYSFAEENNFKEEDFFKYFSNFEAIEQSILESFFEQTISLLENSDDYLTYDSRNKLLSFYFTFFELLSANRSYVTYALKNKVSLKFLKPLKELKNIFGNYIDTLEIETIDFKQKHLEDIQMKSLKEGAWIQLIVTIKFWLDDTSSEFEKTDIFIEKCINTSFDLISVQPIKSIIDLGKFLYKEKMMK